MSEPLHLQDHTWLVRREHLMHSFNGHAIPGWMGGAVHLPSLAAGAVLGPLLGGCVAAVSVVAQASSGAAAAAGVMSTVMFGVAIYMAWRKLPVIKWAAQSVNWWRQPARIGMDQPGGPEPDVFRYATILWRPVDPGWEARRRQFGAYIQHTSRRGGENGAA